MLDAAVCSRRHLNDLPGPPAWPVVGNLLQLRPGRIHLDMERWSRQYGVLYRVRMARATFLVVADHRLVGQILRERPGLFRRPSIVAELAAEMGGIPGVFEAEGAAWRNQRRMVMQAFAPQAVKSYFPSLVTVAQRLRRRWERAADGGRAIDLNADLRLYTIDIVAGLAFGSDVNTIETGDHAIQRDLDVILPAVARRSLAPFPYWRYVKLPADRQLARSVAAVTLAVDDLVGQAKARMLADPVRTLAPPNMLESMLAAAAQPDSEVSERDVAGNVLTMLLAGEDTTSNSLAWLIYLLRRHPEALERARAEVLRVEPDSASLSVGQADQLDYLEACAHEAMRLKPPVPYMPVEALEDTVVGDVAVSKGTVVTCVLRHDSVDEAYFPDAGSFRPERWLDAQVERKVAMPFGAGPRTCPGRYLALLEIKVAMCMLLAHFDIVSVASPDGGEPRERMGFVMAPSMLELRLARR